MRIFFSILAIFITVLIVLYVLLPYIAKDFANRYIADFEGYDGGIENIDISLFRGGYVFEGIRLERTAREEAIDYLEIEKLGFTIDWKPLFKGEIVADILILNPVIHILPPPPDAEEDTTDLLDLIKNLMPISINRLAVENGRINFVDYQTDPRVNVYLHNLNLVATNLSNVEAKDALPSTLVLSGTSVGGGNLNLDMKADFMRQIPNLDMELSFENIDLTAFNEVTQAYANFKFDSGIFHVYSEMAIKNGAIFGYIKPVMEKVQVISGKPNEEKGFLQTLWEGLLDMTAGILKNPREEHIATEVKIRGRLDDPDTPVVDAILNIFRNAFIEAFQKGLQDSVDFDEMGMNDMDENK